MKTSKHAKMRQQQRGIKPELQDLILHHGTKIRKPGNAFE